MGWGNYFTSTKDGITVYNGSEFIFKGLYAHPEQIKSLENITIAYVTAYFISFQEKFSNKLVDLSVSFAVEILSLVKYLKIQHEAIICNQTGRKSQPAAELAFLLRIKQIPAPGGNVMFPFCQTAFAVSL